MLEVPERFLTVTYNGANVPRDVPYDLTVGANCQVFAYALLQHFGIAIPPLRSSELWSDATFTRRVNDYRPLDLLLFNRTEEARGAHVALFVGDGKAIHLCASEGRPVIWTVDEPRAAGRIRGLARWQASARVRTYVVTRSDPNP